MNDARAITMTVAHIVFDFVVPSGVNHGLDLVSQVARAETRLSHSASGASGREIQVVQEHGNSTMLHKCEDWGGLRRSILEELERIKQRSILFAVCDDENSTCVALREMAHEPFVIRYTVR